MKDKSKEKTPAELANALRRTWGINPITKIIPDKRKKKPKYKKAEEE